MHIPDPIEQMEARQERLAFEWDKTQGDDLQVGSFRCPYCSEIFDYEPIQLNGRPDSQIMCLDCLPDDVKKVYDKFDGGTT